MSAIEVDLRLRSPHWSRVKTSADTVIDSNGLWVRADHDCSDPTDPEVLVLDEPTSGLDLGARELLIGALAEIMAGSKSPQIVLVTHQIEEIPAGVTHCAIMSAGTIAHQGPIDDVLTGVTLSEVYGMPLLAGRNEGRWWARGVTD